MCPVVVLQLLLKHIHNFICTFYWSKAENKNALLAYSVVAFTKEDTSETKESAMKQPKKKLKAEKSSLLAENEHESLKTLLMEFNKDILKRLDTIDGRLDFLAENCDILEEKVENISSIVDKHKAVSSTALFNSFAEDGTGLSIPISPRVTFVTLNTEDDYPNGSWLGNEANPEARVRCHISPSELFHINTTCKTAEKMALTLLDYLFDRETQACSNISGMGKHKKKQLDPLFIYGIKCHLNFHFGITDQGWNRIKQNLDSKCRTAFRRKIKGLPLIPKGVSNSSLRKQDRNLNVSDYSEPLSGDSVLTDASTDENLTFRTVETVTGENILERVMHEAKLIHSEPEHFEILHATVEVADIQDTHQIQL